MQRAKWGSIYIRRTLKTSLEGDPGPHEHGGEGHQQASQERCGDGDGVHAKRSVALAGRRRAASSSSRGGVDGASEASRDTEPAGREGNGLTTR